MSASALPDREHLTRIPVWLPSDQAVIYLLTLCTADRRTLFISPDVVLMVLGCIEDASTRTNWAVHQICFMPDHIHMFVSPKIDREQKLSRLVQRLKSSATQKLHAAGITGGIWQAEFFDHLLRSHESLHDKWLYVMANPVRAGLCSTPEEYPFLGTPAEIRKRVR